MKKTIPQAGDIWRIFDSAYAYYLDVEIIDCRPKKQDAGQFYEVVYDELPSFDKEMAMNALYRPGPLDVDHCVISLTRWIQKNTELITPAKERRGVIVSKKIGIV